LPVSLVLPLIQKVSVGEVPQLTAATGASPPWSTEFWNRPDPEPLFALSGTPSLAENEPLRASAELRVGRTMLAPCQASANSPLLLATASKPALASALMPTMKLRETVAAAAKVLLPTWLASSVHVPVATKVSVLPLTVQTPVVVDVSTTGKPELALATKAAGVMPKVWVPGAVKLMVCAVNGAAATLKLRETVVAAKKAPLPVWLASTEQVPTATSVSVVPATVHTPGVVDAKVTVKPEVALALSAAGAVPRVWLPGDVKVMLCASGAAKTVKLRETLGAAAKVLLPTWLASTLQVPAATSVKVLPLTVQTPVVVDVNTTVRPEVELATRAGGAVPKV
jgi:hypothetical protein